jgi:hypothetical protein
LSLRHLFTGKIRRQRRLPTKTLLAYFCQTIRCKRY